MIEWACYAVSLTSQCGCCIDATRPFSLSKILVFTVLSFTVQHHWGTLGSKAILKYSNDLITSQWLSNCDITIQVLSSRECFSRCRAWWIFHQNKTWSLSAPYVVSGFCLLPDPVLNQWNIAIVCLFVILYSHLTMHN